MTKNTPHTSLWWILILLTIISLNGCRRKYTPKPIGHFRIDLPKKEYQRLDNSLPYSFEYAKIATIRKEHKRNSERYWINIDYPKYKGTIHLSYKSLNNNLEKLMEDSRDLVYKHTIKADGINERQFENRKNKVFGILYQIKGNTASSVQFVATDSTNHFLRGALYFMTQPNQDSLAPLIDYIERDIQHLMETLSWE